MAFVLNANWGSCGSVASANLYWLTSEEFEHVWNDPVELHDVCFDMVYIIFVWGSVCLCLHILFAIVNDEVIKKSLNVCRQKLAKKQTKTSALCHCHFMLNHCALLSKLKVSCAFCVQRNGQNMIPILNNTKQGGWVITEGHFPIEDELDSTLAAKIKWPFPRFTIFIMSKHCSV